MTRDGVGRQGSSSRASHSDAVELRREIQHGGGMTPVRELRSISRSQRWSTYLLLAVLLVNTALLVFLATRIR